MSYTDQAGRLWPFLVELARERRTATYLEAAENLGHKNYRAIGRVLHPIFEACRDEGWPIITGLIVLKETGRPGSGLDPWIDDFDDYKHRIWAFDWGSQLPSLPVPGALDLIQPGSFRVEDTFMSVKGRGPYQGHFRQTLLQNYVWCCALCDTRLGSLLVAGHIIPWSIDPDNRLNPRNGILLCRSHDCLFELGIIRVRENLEIQIKLPEARLGEDVLDFLNSHTADQLRKPRQHPPDPVLLRRRLNALEKEDRPLKP